MSDPTMKSREQTRADQLARLRALIAELIPANRFYAARLQQAGITPGIASLDEFSRRMPFTTKQDLVDDQLANPPYGSALTYPIERYTRYTQTSGTTRMPIRWLDTTESWNWMLGNWDRVFDAAGVTRDDRVLFTFSFGPFLGFWLAYDCAVRRGCLVIPAGGLGSEARLRMLIENEATVLCCTPTYAIRLAESAPQAGFDLAKAKVRRVVVAGEPGGSIPAVRCRIGELWNDARVIDHHGMTEVGAVSYQSPTRDDLLHVIESSYYAEVIDPRSDRPVNLNDADATGELVLTNLGRWGSPLLRYRTGDLVKPVYFERGDMALQGGILGRVDDMIVVRSVNVFPSVVEEVMRSHREVAEYRVRVVTRRAMTELSMELEPTPDCVDAPALARQIERELHAALSLRVPVNVVASDTLPRFEMKARRWVRVEQ
jgi:phenylacetate-CoA ligase